MKTIEIISEIEQKETQLKKFRILWNKIGH